MADLVCGDCGSPLIEMAVSEQDIEWAAAFQAMTNGPFDFRWLSCTGCGAAWVRYTDGTLKKRVPRLSW